MFEYGKIYCRMASNMWQQKGSVGNRVIKAGLLLLAFFRVE